MAESQPILAHAALQLNAHNLARFHTKYVVVESGCWEWSGRLNAHGYGVFVIGHAKTFLAHRVSYEHFKGPLPNGLRALHQCDNPKCVNPDHLFSGTQADNVRDMVEKGRNVSVPRFGESNPAAVLSDAQVEEIKAAYVPRKVTLRKLADRYGVSESLLSMIINGKRRSRRQAAGEETWRRMGSRRVLTNSLTPES